MFPQALVPLVAALLAPQDPLPYGFSGHELYKLGQGCGELRAGDLNGDGLADLVLSNPRRARIELLLRLPADADDHVDRSVRAQANQVEYDGRFAVRHHPVEREVERLAVGDWDGDGRDDAAWVAVGGELHLLFGAAAGDAPRTTQRRVELLRGGCALLEAVDLEGDGRDELLALGRRELAVLVPGGPDEEAAAERVLDVAPAGLDRLALADLDGDGLRDLVYLFVDEEQPVRFRPGRPGGGFGPRLDVRLPPLREARVADLDGDGTAEVLAVFRDSGRVSVLELREAGGAEGSGPARGVLERQALRPLEDRGARRSFALGDLDGDGRAEVVVAEPDVSEVRVIRSRGSELVGSSHPNMVDVAQPRIGDLDGDGSAELVTISAAERMLGIARGAADPAALPFPRTVPLEGAPQAVELADLDGDGALEVVLLVSSGEGRARRFLALVRPGGPGEVAPADWRRTELEGLDKSPAALLLPDLDQDGRRDLLAFLGDRDAPALGRGPEFRLDARGGEAPGLGVLEGARRGLVSLGDVDGDGRPELLAASRNFARALRFEDGGDGRLEPVVVAQFNGPAPDSSIRAALLAELDGAPPAELVLLDQRTQELLVYARGGEAPELRARLEAPGLDPDVLRAGDLDGDGRDDLVLLAQDQLAVRFGAGRSVELAARASYDPELEQTWLDTLAAGDLNGDGLLDVLAVEGFEHHLVILAEETASGDGAGDDGVLARRLEFPVFEKRPLEEGRSREPRELVCADLDGDGQADVAALVHDKLIVYLQDRLP